MFIIRLMFNTVGCTYEVDNNMCMVGIEQLFIPVLL